MKEFNIDLNGSDTDSHECTSIKEGDWIVFHCPQCPGYERRINIRTHEMELQDPTRGKYSHSGRYSAHQFDHAFKFVN